MYRAIFWSRFANYDYSQWLEACGLNQVARSRHFLAVEGPRDSIHNFEVESGIDLLEVIQLETVH